MFNNMICLYKSLCYVALFLFCLFLCNTFLLLSSTVCTDLHLPTASVNPTELKNRGPPFSLFFHELSSLSVGIPRRIILRFARVWLTAQSHTRKGLSVCVSPEVQVDVLKWNRRFWISSSRWDSENNWEFSFWHLG